MAERKRLERIVVTPSEYHNLGRAMISMAEEMCQAGETERVVDLGSVHDLLDGIIASWPDYLQDRTLPVKWIQSDKKEHLIIKLPPLELIKDSLDNPPEGGYPLPEFYREALTPGTEPTTPEEKKELFRRRIGDYTMSLCI